MSTLTDIVNATLAGRALDTRVFAQLNSLSGKFEEYFRDSVRIRNLGGPNNDGRILSALKYIVSVQEWLSKSPLEPGTESPSQETGIDFSSLGARDGRGLRIELTAAMARAGTAAEQAAYQIASEQLASVLKNLGDELNLMDECSRDPYNHLLSQLEALRKSNEGKVTYMASIAASLQEVVKLRQELTTFGLKFHGLVPERLIKSPEWNFDAYLSSGLAHLFYGDSSTASYRFRNAARLLPKTGDNALNLGLLNTLATYAPLIQTDVLKPVFDRIKLSREFAAAPSASYA